MIVVSGFGYSTFLNFIKIDCVFFLCFFSKTFGVFVLGFCNVGGPEFRLIFFQPFFVIARTLGFRAVREDDCAAGVDEDVLIPAFDKSFSFHVPFERVPYFQ